MGAVIEPLLAKYQVIHISGSADAAEVQAKHEALPAELKRHYHVFEYVHDMGLAFAAADLVVSRAGASILGEYPLFGLPSILIPYPYAWRYQKVNADYLVTRGAAIRLDDETLGETLLPTIERLMSDEAQLHAVERGGPIAGAARSGAEVGADFAGNGGMTIPLPNPLNTTETVLIGLLLLFFALWGWRHGLDAAILWGLFVIFAAWAAPELAAPLGKIFNACVGLVQLLMSGQFSMENWTAVINAQSQAMTAPVDVQDPNSSSMQLMTLAIFGMITYLGFRYAQKKAGGKDPFIASIFGAAGRHGGGIYHRPLCARPVVLVSTDADGGNRAERYSADQHQCDAAGGRGPGAGGVWHPAV